STLFPVRGKRVLCSCKAFKNENSDIMRPFITACLFIVLVSCNDDDPAPVQTDDALLTRISADGITELELFYDIHKNVYRLEHYSGGNLSSYTLYDYDEKGRQDTFQSFRDCCGWSFCTATRKISH